MNFNDLEMYLLINICRTMIDGQIKVIEGVQSKCEQYSGIPLETVLEQKQTLESIERKVLKYAEERGILNERENS
jgi:hypothetical protein